MKAEKGNREYSIDKNQKKFYQDRGFDIKDDSGKVIAYGRGKMVTYDEYEKVLAKNKELEEQTSKLQEELDTATEKQKSPQREKAEKGSSSNAGEDGKKG